MQAHLGGTRKDTRRLQEPVRVLHLIDSLRPGGAETLVLTTVKHLDPERFRSVVVALFPPLDLKEDLERLGVPVYHLGLRGPLDWRRGVLTLAGLLRCQRPDILHTHLRFATVYGRVAALLARIPAVVTTLHHLDYTYFTSDRWRFKLWKFTDRVTGPLVNKAFIAVSQAVCDDYFRHFKLAGVKIIYNYLDPDDFGPLPPKKVEAKRQEFKWTDKEFVLLNVARLAWEKGQRYLLLAMPEILKVIPEARLLLVGDGPAQESLRGLSRALGLEEIVVFAGKRRDISSLLGMVDLFVFPSVGEGLGIALLEAMARGLPIVASRVDGIAEIVREGVDGLLVAAEDAGRIAESVVRLHGDPELRRNLGLQAQLTVARRFSAKAGVSILESVYADLLSSVSCWPHKPPVVGNVSENRHV